MTERLAILNWHLALVYPKGRPVREQQVRADLTLPSGWKYGTALPVEGEKGATVRFKPASLETLVDSPVLCGAHLKEIPLGIHMTTSRLPQRARASRRSKLLLVWGSPQRVV